MRARRGQCEGLRSVEGMSREAGRVGVSFLGWADAGRLRGPGRLRTEGRRAGQASIVNKAQAYLHVDIPHETLDVLNLPLGLVVPVLLLDPFEFVQLEEQDLLGLFRVRDGAVVAVRDKVERERDEHVQLREGAVRGGVEGREEVERRGVFVDGAVELFCEATVSG